MSKRKRDLSIIAEELVDIAIAVEGAKESEAPIIDIVVALYALHEIVEELDRHRESCLV